MYLKPSISTITKSVFGLLFVFGLFLFTSNTSPANAYCWTEGDSEFCAEVPVDVEDPCHPQENPDGCGGENEPERVTNGECISAGTVLPGGGTVIEGQTYSATIQMKNLGNVIWKQSDNFRLGSQTPQDNTNWGRQRVDMPGDISQDQTATFTFDVTAPDAGLAPGETTTYNFDWRMVVEGEKWFGGTCYGAVTVKSKTPATPTVDVPACIEEDYTGSGVSITWESLDPAVTYVDITTTPNAWTYWFNKSTNAVSVTAPNGFQDGSNPRQNLVLQPDTQYSVRTYNGYANSANATFSIPACAAEAEISITIDIGEGGNISFQGKNSTSGAALETNRGVGWINPIKLIMEGSPGELMKVYYIIFYDKDETPNGTALCAAANGNYDADCVAGFLQDVKGILTGDNYQNGFILRYEVQDVDSDGKVGYSAWVNGRWERDLVQGNPFEVTGMYIFTPYTGSSDGTSWDVLFDNSFNSKDMYTPIYAVDIYGRAAFKHDAVLEYPRKMTYDVSFVRLANGPSSY